MRVIAGLAKGRRLQSVPGDTTRPITDRAKEALFSIIGDWIIDTRVLDLFGGTGAVGIEALSRGAASVQYVELNRRAVQTIQTNLRNCGFTPQAVVTQGDSFAFLARYGGEPFDFVYIAPPQYQGLWHKALLQVDARPELLTDYGTVVVQIHPREETPVHLSVLEEYDRRKYGSVLLLFYARAETLVEDDEDDEESETATDAYVDEDQDEGDSP